MVDKKVKFTVEEVKIISNAVNDKIELLKENMNIGNLYWPCQDSQQEKVLNKLREIDKKLTGLC